jgi:DNA-binding response OmpR family regulator
MAASVLIIDDDRLVCETLADVLEADGYEVLGARDAAKVLDVLEHAEPDLILLDLSMPGMDGTAFLRAYRQREGSQAPIILVSAAADLGQRAAELGVAGYLPKPFKLENLLDLVRSHTAR